ncbi:hypothetical protein FM037_19855 [Shewanella psychropiezotolerans]|uniref:Uncharacterized protein n=1 Tax=Shewanella psychropiezotolerans TaxID=2593655 RepID=A0ABX5X154_9GAMM|nr:hypothetical protein [Shewanella psychropiezotolerans]QDO85074.1 hypothetical protein FM037_19855 [Shewanella psychropiezotolerans]
MSKSHADEYLLNRGALCAAKLTMIFSGLFSIKSHADEYLLDSGALSAAKLRSRIVIYDL